MLNELVIYQKCYDLILYAYPIITKYPRNARFTLGQQTVDLMIYTARLISRANRERDKKRTLWEIDGNLEQLRLLTRLAKDMKMLSVHQYGLVNERISELGRLLGGWMKSCAE
jgi:hypothetical protein